MAHKRFRKGFVEMSKNKKSKLDDNFRHKEVLCAQCGVPLSQEDIKKGYRICEFCRQDYGKDYRQKFVKRYKDIDPDDNLDYEYLH